MTILRIEHAAIRVQDLNAAIDFYCDGLGLLVSNRTDSSAQLTCGGDVGFDLSLSAGGTGLDHLALSSQALTDFASAEARLNERGILARRVEISEPNVEGAIRFELPTSQVVELIVRTQPAHYAHPSERYHEGFLNLIDINHVTLMCSSVRETSDLLTEALGLHVSDVVAPDAGAWRAAFLRAGENHHDIAIINGPTALHHIAFGVSDVSDLVRCCDRLAHLGYRTEYGIGRHGPGGNIFLYVRDPAGNRVELTCEMARIADPSSPTRYWQRDALADVNVWSTSQLPESFRFGT